MRSTVAVSVAPSIEGRMRAWWRPRWPTPMTAIRIGVTDRATRSRDRRRRASDDDDPRLVSRSNHIVAVDEERAPGVDRQPVGAGGPHHRYRRAADDRYVES